MGGRFSRRRTAASAERGEVRPIAGFNAAMVKLSTFPHVHSGELTEVARALTSAAAEALAVERLSVWMLSEDRSRLELVDLFRSSVSEHSAGMVLQAPDYPSYFAALADGRAIDAHDAHTDPRTREFSAGYLTPLSIQSMLDAAIRFEGRVVGVVCCEHVGDEPRTWRASEIAFAGQLGDVVGQTLTNSHRRLAEKEVRALNRELEQRVHDRTRELEAAKAEVEAFTYSVSHDLRAPLRHLRHASFVLLDEHAGNLSREARDILTRIDESGRRMQEIVEGLLTLSSISHAHIKRRVIDVAGMVESVWSEVRPRYGIDPAALGLEDLPDGHGDPVLVRQVWANLLDNAAKYSAQRGAPKISVSSFERAGRTWYAVRDNGIGFDAKFIDKAFAPFERLHEPGDFPGTGIGLALVKRIVTRHGGDIEAESSVAGSTFAFTIEPAQPTA